MSSASYKRLAPYALRDLDVAATYEEVAAEMGISVARVGQIETMALARLRRCFGLIENGMSVDAAIRLCTARRSTS